MESKIIIVGGGITGLTIGYELSRSGLDVVILEKEKEIGGLARSFRYGDFIFDIGPHRFYTAKDRISQFMDNILGQGRRIIARNSGVYLSEKYFPWPLSPLALFNLPLDVIISSGFDLLFGKIRDSRLQRSSFKNYIITRYGPTLYSAFFKDYTEKFLMLSAGDTHADWAETGIARAVIDERIASRNLFDILKLLMMPVPIKTEFLYPCGGMGVFCEKLAESIETNGGLIIREARIKELLYSDKKIFTVVYDKGSLISDKLIWTAPIGEICKELNLSCNVNLEYLALVVYFLVINRPIKQNYQWCYFGQKDIIFNRISNPSMFDPASSPRGKTGLCIEVTCKECDETWNNPKHLIGKIKSDLQKVSFIENEEDIDSIYIERIPSAYPIYKLDYRKQLFEIKERLKKFSNLVLAGRTGLFWYNNMDDCIENGIEISRQIVSELDMRRPLPCNAATARYIGN